MLGSVVRRRVAADGARAASCSSSGPAQTRMLRRLAGDAATRSLAAPGPAARRSARRRSAARCGRPARSSRRRSPGTAVSCSAIATRLGTAVPAIGLAADAQGLVTRPPIMQATARVGPVDSRIPARGPATATRTARRACATTRRRSRGRAAGARRPLPAHAELKAGARREPRPAADRCAALLRRVLDAAARSPGPTQARRVACSRGPSFPQPMYEALRDLSPELLLPGVGTIDADTVTLLEPQPALHRGVHGRPQPRARRGAALARVPGRPARTRTSARSGTRAARPPIGQLPPIRDWEPGAPLGDSFAPARSSSCC